MRDAFRKVVRGGYPVITPVLRDIYRIKTIFSYGFTPFFQSLSWYFRSKEYTNFTYDISAKSKKYLIAFLSNTFDVPRELVSSYLDEVEQNEHLKRHFLDHIPTTNDRYFADLPIKYGRRIGWYAIVRILKPKIIIESGIDRGIGTCVLAAAVQQNAAEGYEGQVIGLDINRFAGSFVIAPYDKVVSIVYGNSIDFLETISEEIDLFIHDSNHSADHEKLEFEKVISKLSQSGLLLTDNADETDVLYDFAHAHGWAFTYWQEEIQNHVSRPGGIGLSYVSK